MEPIGPVRRRPYTALSSPMPISTADRSVLFVLTALAITAAACNGKFTAPRLTFINVGFTLQLPNGTQHALDSLAPGFRSVNVGKFRSDIAQYAAEAGGGMQPWFATVAGFDGDGNLDAVIEGTTRGDSALRVIAVLNGARPTAMEVTRIPKYDVDAVWRYLSRHMGNGPGTFQLVDYPDSTTAYEHRGGCFVGTKVGN